MNLILSFVIHECGTSLKLFRCKKFLLCFVVFCLQIMHLLSYFFFVCFFCSFWRFQTPNFHFWYKGIKCPMTAKLIFLVLWVVFFFFCRFFAVFMWAIVLSVNKDSFIFSFLICMLFISFSCHVALTRTSSTVLSKSCGKGHPLLVLDLSGKANYSLTIKCDF